MHVSPWNEWHKERNLEVVTGKAAWEVSIATPSSLPQQLRAAWHVHIARSLEDTVVSPWLGGSGVSC